MRVLLLICALLTFAVGVAAQSNEPCPSVSVENPLMVDGTKQPIVFSARVKIDAVSAARLQYKWHVSSGRIIAGQNTSSITVDIKGLGGTSVDASVQIIGLDDPCSTASGRATIFDEPPRPTMYDRYGDIRLRDEHARLDEFATVLKKHPETRGMIFVYAGNPTYKGEAAYRIRRAKNYLVNVRGISAKRLMTFDAGYDTDLTTYLWIVPRFASPPGYELRVPLSEVRFTKPKPSAIRKSTPRRRSY